MQLTEVVNWCDRLLDAADYRDYCPNGLQVEGRAEVRRIVSGVTASRALVEAAVARQADLLLVHHGWFWKGEDPRIVGMKLGRLRPLLANGISLLAYHLPLDGHPELGNNAQLAGVLDLQVAGRFDSRPGAHPHGGLACWAALPEPLDGAEFAALLEHRLQRGIVHISGGGRPLQRIGWCSGAAQDWIVHAAALGLDGFFSGEISERTVHEARELGIDYFAAGHHATERYGVQALGRHLAEKFDIAHEFVDIDNPV